MIRRYKTKNTINKKKDLKKIKYEVKFTKEQIDNIMT